MPGADSNSRLSTRRGQAGHKRRLCSLWSLLLALLMVLFLWVGVQFHWLSTTGKGEGSISNMLPQSWASPPASKGSTSTTRPVKIDNHTVMLWERPQQPITVAYAISLIKCGDFQSTPEGLVDAALVMRHSIHQTSVHSTDKNSTHTKRSHYDYKMYAIVHTDAKPCSQNLIDAGFEVVFKDRPVQSQDISNTFLRQNIHKEWCCGHDEFIKLYAYTLPEPLVVHVDIDFVFYQPMDHVFDALLYHKASAIGQAARRALERERPGDLWPDQPQAVMTRDWPQVLPGRKPGYQAGFLVARSNPQVTEDVFEIIKTGNYVDGFSRENGWGGKGYGGFVGAMAMQGLMAYYYDEHAPNTWVELNQCRYNHMGMDVRFNKGGPGFRNGRHAGKCRNDQPDCEDCRVTPLSDIYNIHYTQCRKPWMCIGLGDSSLPLEKQRKPRTRTRAEKNLIPEESVHLKHCLPLLQIWHNHRSDLEEKLEALVGMRQQNMTALARIHKGRVGGYKQEFFQGHCKALAEYNTLAQGDQSILKLIPLLYKKS